MRLIATIKNKKQGRTFSLFLTQKGIDHLCEASADHDWGRDKYGHRSYQIWIYNENQVEEAAKWYTQFQENPDAPQFVTLEKHLEALLQPEIKKLKPQKPLKPFRPSSQKSLSLTVMFLVACIIFFMWTSIQERTDLKAPSYFPSTVVYSSSFKKTMLYDYPQSFEYMDQLWLLYDQEKLQDPKKLPKEGQHLLQRYLQTRYWKGLYHHVLKRHERPELGWKYYGQMFEKIQQGEVWRLFTPSLLHGDLFHLFFNMIWLLVLGHQIEERTGKLRYFLFILICGILSNSFQYLMSGPSFLGFSGVICGMLGFIWARKACAPNESYRIQQMTMLFITAFIVGMALLQFLGFLAEFFLGFKAFTPPIANTAHLTGFAIGHIIGRTKLMEARN